MTSAICTLFEDHYHNGVAALINSLYKNGFRGDFYAGYRGTLPTWAGKAVESSILQWSGAKSLKVAEGLNIHFLPVTTNFHFAHYKPDFMLALMNSNTQPDFVAYFDPDIINLCNWA